MDFKRYGRLILMVVFIWSVVAIFFMGYNFNIEEVKSFLLSVGLFLVICSVIAAVIYGVTDDDARSQNGDYSIFNEHVKCVLLDGAWGIGKTYYYEKCIKPNLEKRPIYITCFSATKDELITRLIMSSAIFSVLSINGVLINLMLNNWQSFMPKNQIIIFDDIERLHRNNGTPYEDIMAIIDYLKKYNKILLIANISEINTVSEHDIDDVFNLYLEKVVDEKIIIPPHNYEDLFNELIPEKEKNHIYHKFIVSAVVAAQKKLIYTNVRILKNCYYHINKACNELNLIIDIKLSTIESSIMAHALESHLIKLISINYLYFKDHSLYNEVINLKINSLSNNYDSRDIDAKLKKYHLTNKDFHKYNLSQKSPISTALSCLSMQRQFVYYSLGNYLQDTYPEENKFINNLYYMMDANLGSPYLYELTKCKLNILNSNIWQHFDNKFLRMDDREDYLESELFVWGCVVYNHQLELAKKIAKCLIKFDGYRNFTEVNHTNIQKYMLENIDKIIGQYLIWFYNEGDTLESLKKRYCELSNGFLSIYLVVMYDLLQVEINVSMSNNNHSEAYHLYIRNFFELQWLYNNEIIIEFLKKHSLHKELENYITCHFKDDEVNLSYYAHLIVYYLKFIQINNHLMNAKIHEFLNNIIKNNIEWSNFLTRKIKELYPNDLTLYNNWKQLTTDSL